MERFARDTVRNVLEVAQHALLSMQMERVLQDIVNDVTKSDAMRAAAREALANARKIGRASCRERVFSDV